jgi:aspartate-semialdehyde dehydrogenase
MIDHSSSIKLPLVTQSTILSEVAMSTYSQSSDAVAVGIVGCTGAVGIEIVSVLEKLSFPVSKLHLFASARSAGKIISTGYGDIVVEEFSVASARQCQYVFLAVSGEFALEHAEAICAGDGPIVIDNSSAFRYMPNIPLVVPEINSSAIGDAKLIANPNCTTAIAAVALWPIHQKFTIKKLIVSTYQAASGAGAEVSIRVS